MKVYIEAYGADGKQILGNLDGQCVIDCKNYKNSNKYQFALRVVREGHSLNGRVKMMKVVKADGTVLETIT